MDLLRYDLIVCENVESDFSEMKSLLKWAGGCLRVGSKQDECTSLERSFISTCNGD